MSDLPAPEKLSAERHVTVVLRLVFGASGELLRGQLLDSDMGAGSWFTGRKGLFRTLRVWLEEEQHPKP